MTMSRWDWDVEVRAALREMGGDHLEALVMRGAIKCGDGGECVGSCVAWSRCCGVSLIVSLRGVIWRLTILKEAAGTGDWVMR